MNDFGYMGDLGTPDDMGGFLDFLKKKSTSSYESMPVLSKGSSGLEVEQLQDLLGIGVDGAFGSGTENAVKAFQMSKSIPASGVVDARTWAALLGEDYKDPAVQAAKQAQTAQTIQQGASVVSDLIAQFTMKPANAQELMEAPVYTPAPEKSFPWAWVVGGLVGFGAVGGLIFYMTRSSKD